MIPKTRSGKTLRRVLRELVENGVEGNFDKEVNVPATVEDRGVVEVARRVVNGMLPSLRSASETDTGCMLVAPMVKRAIGKFS